MPHYFFDIDDGQQLTKDETGLDLGDLHQARNQAIMALTEIVRDVLPDGAHREFMSQVRDQDGQVLFKARMSFQSEWSSANDNAA